MKISICDSCKAKNVEGILCRHCDTTFCYDCLDIKPEEMRVCKVCEMFICAECANGLIECDVKKG